MWIFNPATMAWEWAPRKSENEDGSSAGAGGESAGGNAGADGDAAGAGAGGDPVPGGDAGAVDGGDAAAGRDGGAGNAGDGAAGAGDGDGGDGVDWDAEPADVAALKEKAEAYDALVAAAPEAPDGYSLGKAEELGVDDAALERFSKLDSVQKARELAHRYKMAPEDFQALVGLHTQAHQELLAPDVEAEKAALGDNWQARTDQAVKFVEGLPEEFQPIAAEMAKRAAGVRMIEHLVDRMKEPTLASDARPTDAGIAEINRQIDAKQTELWQIKSGDVRKKQALHQELESLRRKRIELKASG